MRPIVLATDGSASAAAAVGQAVELAGESQAPLLVVTVWDSPYTGLGYAPLPAVVDVNAEMVERAPQIVEDVARRGHRRCRHDDDRAVCGLNDTLRDAAVERPAHASPNGGSR